MVRGIIPKEFYIGRYIYLTNMLNNLPKASFNKNEGQVVIAVVTTDKVTGREIKRRISPKNSDWNRYRDIALKRKSLKDQYKKLMTNWSRDYHGSLALISKDYELHPNTDNVFSSELWESFNNGDCAAEKKRQVSHNGLILRSQFEAEAAEILDEMGIEYKYDVRIKTSSAGNLYPDFAMNFPEYNRCGFLELLGLLGYVYYVNENAEKFSRYISVGLYPNRDIAFASADGNYRPEHDTIRRIIGAIIDSFARQYVLKKSSTEQMTDFFAKKSV